MKADKSHKTVKKQNRIERRQTDLNGTVAYYRTTTVRYRYK